MCQLGGTCEVEYRDREVSREWPCVYAVSERGGITATYGYFESDCPRGPTYDWLMDKKVTKVHLIEKEDRLSNS